MTFIHAGGTVIEKQLNNETLKIDTGCIVAFESSINFDIQTSGNLKTNYLAVKGYFWRLLAIPVGFGCNRCPLRNWFWPWHPMGKIEEKRTGQF